MGVDSGGERASAMYSLIGSARLNDIDPQAYLRYVLTHIADHPSIAFRHSCLGTLPACCNRRRADDLKFAQRQVW
jgi:hypothetical protein